MTIHKYISIGFIFLMALIVSCADANKEEHPSNIIEKEVFTQMIVEMQLVEAHLNEVRVDHMVIRDSANNYFQEVLDKHGKTFDEFNGTMSYYAAKPEELQGIYDKVLEALSEMEVDLIDVNMDQDAISPLGEKQIVSVVSHLPVSYMYRDTSLTSTQTQDSLFKYIAMNLSLFDSLPYNIESFQKSYIGLTFNKVRYFAFKEQVKLTLDSLELK